MRIAIGQFNEMSDEKLRFAAQIGVHSVQMNTPKLPGEHRWEVADLRSLVEQCERYDLTLEAIENVPIHFYNKAMLGLEGRVVQTGWTESSEIPAFYAGASALLFPTLHEGFGLPLVEAMATGVPVAASNVYSIPEVGGDAILTFDPHDVEAMSAQLERALVDDELRERLVTRGFERARRFNWTESARQTAAVYRDLLSDARA